MRFHYSTTDPSQNEFDSLPRIPLILHREDRAAETLGLVDSGATINVMPYSVGTQLGAKWEDRNATVQLSGTLSSQLAIPFLTMAQVGEFTPVELVFAWIKDSNVPLILGQTNFFLEFDICFYRSRKEFEINPKIE